MNNTEERSACILTGMRPEKPFEESGCALPVPPVEAVSDSRRVDLPLDQPRFQQGLEMLGDRRLRHGNDGGKLTGETAGLRSEQLQDLQAHRMRERPGETRHGFFVFGVGYVRRRSLHSGFVAN